MAAGTGLTSRLTQTPTWSSLAGTGSEIVVTDHGDASALSIPALWTDGGEGLIVNPQQEFAKAEVPKLNRHCTSYQKGRTVFRF